MAGSGSKPPTKGARALRDRRSVEEESEELEGEDAVVEMVEIMSCPKEVRGDQVRRLANAMSDIDLGLDLAKLAARLHPNSPLVPVLLEIAATYQRHYRDYKALLNRLVVAEDACGTHGHVTLDDEALRALMATMFKTSVDENVE